MKHTISQLHTRREKNVIASVVSNLFSGKMRAPDKELSSRDNYYTKSQTNKFRIFKTVDRRQTWKEIKNSVVNFYLEDENSLLAPGVRDFVTKNKRNMRKRYMVNTIENLYKKYCNTSGQNISKAIFYNMRPFWVVKKKYQFVIHVCAYIIQISNLSSTGCDFYKIIEVKSLQTFIESIRCHVTKKIVCIKNIMSVLMC